MTKQDYETLETLIMQQLMQLENLAKANTEITDKLNVAESVSRRDVIDYSVMAVVGFSIDMQFEMIQTALYTIRECAPKRSDKE